MIRNVNDFYIPPSRHPLTGLQSEGNIRSAFSFFPAIAERITHTHTQRAREREYHSKKCSTVRLHREFNTLHLIPWPCESTEILMHEASLMWPRGHYYCLTSVFFALASLCLLVYLNNHSKPKIYIIYLLIL